MKISNVQFHSLIKKVAITAPVLFATQVAVAQKPTLTQDVFEKSENIENEILEEQGLISPEIFVAGETVYPAIVVDLSEKQLYKYDQDTYLEAVYPVAVGKPSTPTNTGLRRVIGVEDYPYLSAPKSTKRFNNPDDYGPKVITLEKISLSTGESLGSDGQFIHGTNRPESIGTEASKGCIRLHNDVVKELTETVFSGQYVLIRE